MRILMVTQHYEPEPHDKFSKLARALTAKGHKVQVITGFPCYPQGKTYDGWQQKIYSEQEVDDILVTRVMQLPDHSRSALRRALYYLSFALSAMTIGLWRARKADVVLVYQAALPVGFPGIVLSFFKRAPLVLDVVDLWPESVSASGMMKNELLLGMIRSVAKFIYRRAKHICVITNSYKENLIALGVPHQKLSVIHMWGYTNPSEQTQPKTNSEETDRFLCVYAGAMGPCQDLSTLLQAAALLKEHRRIKFRLVGDGICFNDLQEQAANQELNNVEFTGRVPPAEIPAHYAQADALVLHLKSDPMSRVSIPSKTIDYLSAGKPIVAAIEGETAQIVRENHCGVVASPEDPQALADAILALEGDKQLCGQVASNASKTYQSKFSPETQVQKIESVLERVNSVSFAPPQDNLRRAA